MMLLLWARVGSGAHQASCAQGMGFDAVWVSPVTSQTGGPVRELQDGWHGERIAQVTLTPAVASSARAQRHAMAP
jgi:hypothetical protein